MSISCEGMKVKGYVAKVYVKVGRELNRRMSNLLHLIDKPLNDEGG